MPETKPDLAFNEEGKCSACIAFEERDNVDWNAREKDLKNIFKTFKKKSYWDCVVPVSGGKDSTLSSFKGFRVWFNTFVCNLYNL